MKSSTAHELAQQKKLAAILEPLGFRSARLGMFFLPDHQFLVHDLTAVDADNPAVVLKVITDKIWDTALEVGASRKVKLIKEILEL